MAERAYHPGVFDRGFPVYVLVCVEEELGFAVFEVGVECGEAHMDLVIAVMDQARRVVCDENVNWRKAVQHLRNLMVFKKVVSPGFVLP